MAEFPPSKPTPVPEIVVGAVKSQGRKAVESRGVKQRSVGTWPVLRGIGRTIQNTAHIIAVARHRLSAGIQLVALVSVMRVFVSWGPNGDWFSGADTIHTLLPLSPKISLNSILIGSSEPYRRR